MTLKAIRQITTGTLSRQAPFDRCFRLNEARHIRELLASGEATSQIELIETSVPGGDGETYRHFGIRRKDGAVPEKFRYVYTTWIYLGWLDYQKSSVQLAQELQQAGAQADAALTVSPRNQVAQAAT